MATLLTAECNEGYQRDFQIDARCPYYFSSDCWLAFQAGALMATRGLSAPAKCRKSRGYSLKITTKGGTDFLFTARGNDLETMELVRL